MIDVKKKIELIEEMSKEIRLPVIALVEDWNKDELIVLLAHAGKTYGMSISGHALKNGYADLKAILPGEIGDYIKKNMPELVVDSI